MKKLKLFGVAAAAAVMMLTSCLGGDNKIEQSIQSVGVVKYDSKTMKPVVATAYGVNVYNPQFTTLGFTPGDCVQFLSEYDSSNPENANDAVNGYTFVTLIKAVAVDKINVKTSMTDTTKVLENEVVLSRAISNTAPLYAAADLDGYMFLTSSFKGLTDQKNRWEMYFDSNQAPVKKSLGSEQINVYSLYLRAVKVDDGKTPSIDNGVTNAYYISSILSMLRSRESMEDNKNFGIQIHYVSKIDEKDSSLVWKVDDTIVGPYSVKESSTN